MKTLLQKYFSFIFAKTNLFVLLCCGFVLSIHQSGFAQQKMWQSLDNEPVILGNRQIIPQKYKVFSLNLAAIKVSLGQAPMENTSAAQAPLTQLEIPLPNGNLETFVVQESPIMEPALAKQFPQIKTYSGYSITNKSTTARFDVTQFGFHAIIFSSEGTFSLTLTTTLPPTTIYVTIKKILPQKNPLPVELVVLFSQW